MGAAVSALSTKLMEDPNNIANFMSFLQARGVASPTIDKHITNVRKVLVWRSSLGGPAAEHARLQEVIGWVDILHAQSAHIGHPSRALEARTDLPHATEVLRFQLKVIKHSTEMLAYDIRKWGCMTRRDTAEACQDTAMACLAFGFLPPLRLGCIRSCFHPLHTGDGCTDEQCR